MFQLDDQFLQSVGLGNMGADEKAAFLALAQEKLEERVGIKMSEGLSKEQITEFERVIDGDKPTIQAVIGDENLTENEVYKLLIKKAGFKEGSDALNAEFAAIKWLTVNRPDYQKLVAAEIERLRDEITTDADRIKSQAG
jgi:hypothetical protein